MFQIKNWSSHPPDYWLLGLLILFYPTAVWLIPSGGSSTFNILGLGGLLCWLIIRKWPCDRQENIVIISLLLYLAATAISWLANGMEDAANKLLRRHMLFVLAAMGTVWLAWRRPGVEFFWWGITIGAILLGGTGIYFFLIENTFRSSIHSLTQVNPIAFGQIATVLFSLTVASFSYFFRLSRGAPIIPLTGTVLCLLTVIGSGTRGAWLAIPVLSILLIINYKKSLTKHWIMVLSGCLIFLILFFGFSGWTVIENRVERAVNDIYNYLNEPEKRVSPVGTRLDMWKAAYNSGMSAPVIGPGKDGYLREVKEGVHAGRYGEEVGVRHFPHNEYATAFGYHGIIGLLALFLLFAVPGTIFWRRWTISQNKAKRDIALAGLLVVLSFAVFSLTDSPLEQRPTIMFYAIMILLPLSLKTGPDNPVKKKSHAG